MNMKVQKPLYYPKMKYSFISLQSQAYRQRF